MAIKLVASDIDGTIINDDGFVSERTTRVIQSLKDKGIEFALVTGRSYEGALKVVKQLGTNKEGYGMICLNGLMTYKFPHIEPKMLTTLTYDECKKLNEIGQHYYMGVLYCFSDTIYIEMKDITYRDYKISIGEDRLRLFNDELKPVPIQNIEEIKERFENGTPFQKLIYIQSDSFMNLVAQRIRNDLPASYDAVIVGGGWMEIMPVDVSKGNALIDYAEGLGIRRDEIMVFGDAENDISMFKITPHCVAMDNAMDTLRSVAKCFTLSNNNDGVADYIEKHVINQD